MSRPRNPVGTHGTINTVEVVPGKWRARTYYRFRNGKLRQVERFGTTESKAKTSLKSALLTIEDGAGGTLSGAMKLAVLGERFLKDRREVGRSAGTLETYQYAVDVHIKPKIGDLTVRESRPELLQEFLMGIYTNNGPGAAKNCRSVLSGMFGYAVRNGAADRNPVRELERIQNKQVRGSKAIPIADLPALRAAVAADAYLVEKDMVDVIEFLLGTGWRVGELCGLVESDVNYAAGTVTMAAIAVRVKGEGVVRQEFGKTDSSRRTNTVPKSVMTILKRRRKEQLENELGLVFPTPLGRLRDPSNTEREWRDRRDDLGFPDTTTHSFRKTVATALDADGLSARDIAEYLGHKNPSVTQDVYMSRATGSKKAAQSLERLVNR
ncbi:site-specific integrase [soil metagenome]